MRKLFLILILALPLSGCIYRPIPGQDVIHETNDIKLPKFPIDIQTDDDYGLVTINSFLITSSLPATGSETSYSANYELDVKTADLTKTEIGFDFAFYNEEGFKIGWYSFKESTTSEGAITMKGNIKIPNGTVEIQFGKTTQ